MATIDVGECSGVPVPRQVLVVRGRCGALSVQGFSLIELMIAIAIVAILAAIALPQLRDYKQRSANGACLSEAKAYMSVAVVNMADSLMPQAYSPRACDASTDLQLNVGDFANPRVVYFTSPAAGSASLRRDVECNTGSGQCGFR